MDPLRIFVCTDFEGHWPVGTAAMVLAHTEKDAGKQLEAVLYAAGLKPDGFTLHEIDATFPSAHILLDGNY